MKYGASFEIRSCFVVLSPFCKLDLAVPTAAQKTRKEWSYFMKKVLDSTNNLPLGDSDGSASDMTPNQIKINNDLNSLLDSLTFDDLGELEKFITDFNRFELDMREHYFSGSSEYLWVHPTNEPESKFLRTNIFVTHHFRYDVHRYHCHNYFQICCCLNGSCSITLEGGELRLNAGDLLILSPGTHHCLKVFCDDCNVLKLYIRRSTFDKAFFSILEEDNLLSDFFKSSLYGGSPESYILFSTQNDNELRLIELKLYREFINHGSYFKTVCDALLIELLCRLMSRHMKTAQLVSDSSSRTATVVGMIHLIRESYKTLTLDEAASNAGYSRSQYCHILKSHTGRTFTQLLTEARIEAASRLLLTTELTITEIGLRVGFNSNEHFHRIFKSIKGCSPKDFRASAVKK